MFNAWPGDWDAAFTPLARGGFIVSAAQVDGRILLVEIASPHGGTLRLANPWGDRALTAYRNGRTAEDVAGRVISLETAVGESVVLVPKGR